MLTSVPHELLLQILHHISPPDLATLILTCQDLYAAATPILYQHIIVTSLQAKSPFYLTLNNQTRKQDQLQNVNRITLETHHHTTGYRLCMACHIPLTALPLLREVILRSCGCGMSERSAPVKPYLVHWQPSRVTLEGWKWPPPWPRIDTPFALPLSVKTLQISPETWRVFYHNRIGPLPPSAADLGAIKRLIVKYDKDSAGYTWTWGPYFGARMTLETLMEMFRVEGLEVVMVGVEALCNGYRGVTGVKELDSVEAEIRRCLAESSVYGGAEKRIQFSSSLQDS